MADADLTMPADVAPLLREAARAIDGERPDAARAALTPLLSRDDVPPEARFLAGRLAALEGDDVAAEAAFAAVLARRPGELAVWVERMLTAARRGTVGTVSKAAKSADLPGAVQRMLRAVGTGKGARAEGTGPLTKRQVAALEAAARSGDAARAGALAGPAVEADPGAARTWLLLGEARAPRDPSAAAAAFEAGLRAAPFAVDLRLGLAAALAASGNRLAALGQARQAARLAPRWAEAQAWFARLALATGLLDRAEAAIGAALDAAPRSEAARRLAVEIALARSDGSLALDRARGLAKPPDLLLARAAAAARDPDLALEAFARAVAADVPGARVERARLLQSLGRLDEAETDLRAALQSRADDGVAARALAYGARLDPDDPVVARIAAALPGAAEPDARLMRYALARVAERHDVEASFRHLAAANHATARHWPHDAAVDRAEWDRVAEVEWPALRAAGQGTGQGTGTARPIFVTGLPRSGTTLVEAILAAHPDVAMGGELGVLPRAVAPLRAALDPDAPPETAALDAAGAAYDRAARAKAAPPDAARLTDKSIHSFVHLGLIRAILPRAAIVVVRRDPRDLALSIWRNHFPDGTHRYAASPEGIAAHMRLFVDAVAFWRAALPPGAFYEVAYEALVADPEDEARTLLAACGLDWDPAVLHFHERTERVDTLSFAQVRRPVSAASAGGWRTVERHIGPLLAALAAEGLLPDDAEG